MANEVTITVKVRREKSDQCRIELFREGHGDDLVEQRADELEKAFTEVARSYMDGGGGEWIKKPEGET